MESERLDGRWKLNQHSFPDLTGNGVCQSVSIRGSHCLAPGAKPEVWLGNEASLGKLPLYSACREALTTARTLPLWDEQPIIILFLIALDNNILVFDGRQIRNLTFTQSFFSIISAINVFLKTHGRGSFPSKV